MQTTFKVFMEVRVHNSGGLLTKDQILQLALQHPNLIEQLEKLGITLVDVDVQTVDNEKTQSV